MFHVIGACKGTSLNTLMVYPGAKFYCDTNNEDRGEGADAKSPVQLGLKTSEYYCRRSVSLNSEQVEVLRTCIKSLAVGISSKARRRKKVINMFSPRFEPAIFVLQNSCHDYGPDEPRS